MTGVSGFAARAMRPLALAQIRYVAPTKPRAAEGLTAQVYRQMEREFGVLPPPVVLHSPAPEAMAGTWLMLRETLLAPGLVDRSVRESVAAAVSAANACPYCVSVHGATLRGLLSTRTSQDGDGRVRDAAAWATECAERFRAAGVGLIPFTADEAPEYAGVAVTFHYLNRMVNAFLEDAPMPPSAPRAGLGLVQHVLSGMIRSASRGIGPAGASLDLLAPAPVPEDLGWARPNRAITQAFARAVEAIDRASAACVPQSVRKLLRSELEVWDGRARGLSRVWLERPLALLPDRDRPAGRLALLVAFASHQVDGSTIAAYREQRPDDADLVALASWAALSAARRAGSWLAVPTARERRYGR